ncbi:MAG: SDR family NAD(P)-dependent oxidoreductase [Deltaproteobacteria bacterium]|nr:SDR family NAD(P)-dependent oxidoreductase [Deltaproteobacteria bacterium]MBI3293209.1 SDR family NAD(P)-dependent oxidoreductase [Deltaproteobacteria bacterium]
MSQILIFVTGASGFLGRVLCRRLIDNGFRVRALSRQVLSEEAGMEWVQGDLVKPESYRSALEGCRAIVHLGADGSFGNGSHYDRVNTLATRDLLKNAESVPSLEHFVFVSTIGAIDRSPGDDCSAPLNETTLGYPSSDYGRSKLAAEAIVRASSLATTILRPGLVVGRQMRQASHVRVFVRMGLRGHPLTHFDLPARYSLIHIDDMASAFTTVLLRPEAYGQTYFVVGEALSLGKLWSWVRNRPALASLGPLRRFLMAKGFIPNFVRSLLPFKVKSLVLDTLWASNDKLRGLGWKSAVSAENMVREIVEDESPRIIWITGAASGLGRAIALESARAGRLLVLIDRQDEGLAITTRQCRSLGAEVQDITCDLGSDDIKALTARLNQLEECPDQVFLVAGFGARGRTTEISEAALVGMVRVNLEARVRLARLAAIRMLKRGRGQIVIVSSSSAFQPLPMMGVYAATNAALLSFGEALSAELKKSGVSVLTVCPGGMRTSFQEQAGVKVLTNDKLADPRSIALAILKAAKAQKRILVVGPRSQSMALLSRLLPRSVQLALWHRLMVNLR